MNLEEFFHRYPKVAIGFSGGTDSAYLLWEGVRAGADIAPFFVKSPFQPNFELEDAKRFCRELGVSLRVLPVDILQYPLVSANDEKRCYYCKQQIFGLLLVKAGEEGYSVVIDGTNASDDIADRPGYVALLEMQVLSPLRLCGITKKELRERSKRAGLFTAEKPSYACLATRVLDSPLTAEKLERAEAAEAALAALGYSDFRVRCRGESALVEMNEHQYPKAVGNFSAIKAALLPFFKKVTLSDTPRKPSV